MGNLPWSATEDQVRNLFAEYGTVNSVNLVSDRETGRARGFGFVEFRKQEEAQKAIEGLNGKELVGKKLMVSEAIEKR